MIFFSTAKSSRHNGLPLTLCWSRVVFPQGLLVAPSDSSSASATTDSGEVKRAHKQEVTTSRYSGSRHHLHSACPTRKAGPATFEFCDPHANRSPLPPAQVKRQLAPREIVGMANDPEPPSTPDRKVQPAHRSSSGAEVDNQHTSNAGIKKPTPPAPRPKARFSFHSSDPELEEGLGLDQSVRVRKARVNIGVCNSERRKRQGSGN